MNFSKKNHEHHKINRSFVSKNQSKNYFRTVTLFLGISLLLLNCEKENFNEIPQSIEKENSFKVKTVKLSEIPQVRDFLVDKANDNIFKSSEIEGAIFDEDNIMEVIDTLQHTNYSFRFKYADTPTSTLYNLVVGKDTNGELSTPYVLKFVCNQEQLEEYINHNFSFNYFKGKVAVHKYTDFFSVGSILKADSVCFTDLDENGDPKPCSNDTLDGSDGSATAGGGDYTGDTTGEDDSSIPEGGGTTSSNDTGGVVTDTEANSESEEESGSGDLCPVVFVFTQEDGSNSYAYGYIDCADIDSKSFSLVTKAGEECPECITLDGTIGVNTTDDMSHEVFIEEQIVDINLDPCSKDILTQLKNLQTNDIAKVLNRFGNPNSKYRWEIQTGTPSVAGNVFETNWRRDNSNNVIENDYITLVDQNYINNATDLAIARTILHESIHAYILSYFDDLTSDSSTLNNFQTDFPNIWNFLVATTNGVAVGDIEDAHHQEMAENFINTISDALAEYDNNQQDSQYYDYLAWGALMNTDAFTSALGPNGYMDQSEQEAILIANQHEDTNSADAKGSPCP